MHDAHYSKDVRSTADTARRSKVAESFVRNLIRRDSGIKAAMVVGSVADGTDRPQSDVDLRIFNTCLPADAHPRREIGCWRDGIYLDVSELPDVWLDTPERIAGCPRHGSSLVFGKIIFDSDGRVTSFLTTLATLFCLNEYHARRIRCYRDIVENRCKEVEISLPTRSWTEACRTLAFPIIDAALMPAICLGISPNTVRGIMQLRIVAPRLLQQFLGIEIPSNVTSQYLAKWLENPRVKEAVQANDFRRHIYNQVLWMANQGDTEAAFHITWALVFFTIDYLKALDYKEEAEEIALCWLEGCAWIGENRIREKLGLLLQFCDESIKELYPHLQTIE